MRKVELSAVSILYNYIVVTVGAMHRPVDFFSICMLGLRNTFIMEDNGIKILF